MNGHRFRCWAVTSLVALALSQVSGADAVGTSLNNKHQSAITHLESQVTRCTDLMAQVTDESEHAAVKRRLDGLRQRIDKLRAGFSQEAHDDLRISLLVEYQRLRAWIAPPAVVPREAATRVAPPAVTDEVPPPRDPLIFRDDQEPLTAVPPAAPGVEPGRHFLDTHCTSCHDQSEKAGNLDLTALTWKPDNDDNRQHWIHIYDRIRSGEMPPKRKARPDAGERMWYLAALGEAITQAEQRVSAQVGRSPQRRLNAYEFENAIRDLLHVPWVQIRGALPADGVAYRFNKSAKALDLSHVQLSRFISQADHALRQAIAVQATRPPSTVRRYYAREQKFLTKEYVQSSFNTSPDRQTFPLIGTTTDVEVRERRAPGTVGEADPAKRELEAVGWVSNAFPRWDRTPIPVAGRYRVRYSGYSIWVGPHGMAKSFSSERDKQGRPNPTRWYLANIDDVSRGRRDEPIAVYAQGGAGNRLLGTFDLTPEPAVHELEVWLSGNESVMPKATRLFMPRPSQPTNPFAQRDGAPAVAFRWVEIEGPLAQEETTAGYRLLFDDLLLTPASKSSGSGKDIHVDAPQPKADAERLLRRFVAQAFRRTAEEADVQDLLALIHRQLDAGVPFAEAMIAGYTAALVSPGFLLVQEPLGRLDQHALATRLALFLSNSSPDQTLRSVAERGELDDPMVLARESERLLNDPKATRFVEAFLDYWLDLRRMDETSPSISLYNDYYLDDALTDAALAETRLYVADVIRRDLPARTLVASDFTFLNERLAQHYGIPGVEGVAMRRVPLPAGSPRGGVLTQASVLKVTANGTTTSPVLRGVWVVDRILGRELPPPPPVDAVEPDIRGAVTIRQQLDKHRADASCASCHRIIDPPGFALENFDVFGGWRERYRAIAPGPPTVDGFGYNGNPFEFHLGLPVDAAGELNDGRRFSDIREFKQLLLDDAGQEQIARTLVHQLVVFATGAPVRFSDRPVVDRILAAAKPEGYRVRQLIHAVIQSRLFRYR